MPYEYIGNLHCHTVYSDGWGTHDDIAAAAISAGLDFVVVTDHNVLVQGVDGYRYQDERRVLLLTGEEIHDQTRQPQKNHLLVYEAGEELAPLAQDPQKLIEAVNDRQGLCFLAHPVDPAAPLFNETDLSWVNWEVSGYDGLEIWNFMTEYKSLLTSWPRAIYYAYRPEYIATAPFPETLARWDQLLAAGKRIFAIGGSDAHAMPMRKGPLERVIFPYDFLFTAVNTHVLTNEPLSGDPDLDRRRLFLNLRRGRSFVGNDLPAATKGFRFSAASDQGQATMGETIKAKFGVSLQIHAPRRCQIRLLRDGNLVRQWENQDQAVLTTQQPGAYRVETHLDYKGKERAWILSNPIFIQS